MPNIDQQIIKSATIDSEKSFPLSAVHNLVVIWNQTKAVSPENGPSTTFKKIIRTKYRRLFRVNDVLHQRFFSLSYLPMLFFGAFHRKYFLFNYHISVNTSHDGLWVV